MEDLKEILGLPQECNDFTDGKARVAHPVNMLDFPKMMSALSMINMNDLWKNMMFPETVEKLKTVMEMTFVDSDIDSVMKNINARNFSAIVKKIMAINGIEFKAPSNDPNVEEV